MRTPKIISKILMFLVRAGLLKYKGPIYQSKGEGQIMDGVYAYQTPDTAGGRMGQSYIEETIEGGKIVVAQGWFTPIRQIEYRGETIKQQMQRLRDGRTLKLG